MMHRDVLSIDTSIALLDVLLDPWHGLDDTRYTSTRKLVTPLLSTLVTRRSLAWTSCWTQSLTSHGAACHQFSQPWASGSPIDKSIALMDELLAQSLPSHVAACRRVPPMLPAL